MKARLVQVGPMKFEARVEDAPAMLLHAPPKGERKDAPSPMQATLAAAMGCTAADVVSVLAKMKEPLTGLEIEAEAERAAEAPRIFTRIRLHYRVRGMGVRDESVRRAIDLSTEKYCSVGTMLRRGGVTWTTTYEILPPG